MRPSILLQVIFLAMLCLFVAVKSSDQMENSWEAARIRQKCVDAREDGAADLLVMEKRMLEYACDRLLRQLTGWRMNLAKSDHSSTPVNLDRFHENLNQTGDKLVNDALENCIKNGMDWIRQGENQIDDNLAGIEVLFDFYLRVIGFTNVEELDYESFSQLLDLLDYERRLLANIEAASAPSQ